MNVVTLSECVTRFSEAGIAAGDAVVLHGSLKAVGWISGGANTVVDALLSLVGPEGTVIVAAQYTANLDPGLLETRLDPQTVTVLRTTQPPFRGKATHLPTMGSLTTAVQLDERSRMSNHPTCAVLALGKHAKWLTADHPLTPAFGEGSPYAKAQELNAKLVLIGVEYAVVSALHTVQVATKTLPWCIHSAAQGSVESPTRSYYLDYAYTCEAFDSIGFAYESTHPVKKTPLGKAVVRCLPLRPFLAFAKTWMERSEVA
jgi:aminoglycoside 3-N-acetyltransferase